MFRYINILIVLLFIPLFYYISLNNPQFPPPPEGAVQSGEPADIESTFRRAYYTNLSREQVINHYKSEFNKNFKIYTPRLNYPPEDAPLLIRDQTKSTFLEEITHPFRESIYINGFEPKTEEYAQYYKGIRYNQKIIVRYVSSDIYFRILTLTLTLIATLFLIKEYGNIKKT